MLATCLQSRCARMVLKISTNQSNRQVKGFRSYLLKITATRRRHFFFLRERCTPLKTAFNWGGHISKCYFELFVNVFLRVVTGLGQKR